MNHAIVIARRELRDRTRLFVLAAGIAVTPFIAAAVPAASGKRADVLGTAAAVLSVALGLGTAVVLGATVVGRELSDRRLSFYFSKPLSPAAIWSGKAAAALLTSLLCFAIVAIPALVALGGAWWRTIATWWAVAGVVAAVAALFFVSHAASTMVRSRSPLVALDLALTAAAAAALYFIAGAVSFAGAFRHAAAILNAVLVLVLIALAVAPVWQLANGRTDVRRNHIALSRVLWTAVAGILVLTALYTAWLITPDADDLVHVEQLQQAPAGDWTIVGGPVRLRPSYAASFVVNRATGETERMPTALWWNNAFSRDGRTLAWAQPHGFLLPSSFELYVRDLEKRENRATGIAASLEQFVLSDDGTRVALVRGETLAVHEIATSRLLAATAGLDGRASHRLFFASPTLVRIYELRDRLRVFELDTARRSFLKKGEAPLGSHPMLMAAADGSRVLLRPSTVADGLTGRPLFTLPAWNADHIRPHMLSDGRVARTGRAGGTVRVQTFAMDGTLRHDIALPGMQSAVISGDTADGKLIVVASAGAGKDRATWIIDLQRGSVERTRRDVRGPLPMWHSGDPRALPLRGELVTLDSQRQAVRWRDGAAPRRLF